MPDAQPPVTANVVSLDLARQRRHYIDLANADPTWQQVRASFSFEGIELTDDNAVQAGRLIAGDVTDEQLVCELRAKHSP